MQYIQPLSFSIAITFSVMVVSAFIVEALKKSAYYKRLSSLRFIKNDRINQLIGVGLIKWAVTKTFWRHFNPKLQVKPVADIAGIKSLRQEMTNAEIAHLIALVMQSVIILVPWVLGWGQVQLVMLAVMNILLNLYPSLLQQSNKARLDRVIGVLERRFATIDT
ncbi:MAG: hypothetical protein Roseis2KO_26210 [Roseivirga sp.]